MGPAKARGGACTQRCEGIRFGNETGLWGKTEGFFRPLLEGSVNSLMQIQLHVGAPKDQQPLVQAGVPQTHQPNTLADNVPNSPNVNHLNAKHTRGSQ